MPENPVGQSVRSCAERQHVENQAVRIQQHPILAAAGYGIYMQRETRKQLIQGETTAGGSVFREFHLIPESS